MQWLRVAREGWRPAAGWTLVLGLLHEFVVRHYWAIAGSDPVQLMALASLVIGQIGIRAWEKTKGGA